MVDLTPDFDEFVNPYTFVPLDEPTIVHRSAPTGHSANPAAAHGDLTAEPGQTASGNRFSGTLTVSWQTKTPMLLPSEAEKEGWLTRGKGSSDIRLPGSSVKGVVRSVHESMFNGCLRIFDEEFRPTYRDALEPELLKGWRLAVVIEAKNGLPTRMLLGEEDAVWVDANSLRGAYADAGLPTTGDLIEHNAVPYEASVGRLQIDHFAGMVKVDRPTPTQTTSENWWLHEAQGRSLLLVTDTAARKRDRIVDGQKLRARAFWATAPLTGDVRFVARQALEEFEKTCAGSRDIQQAKEDERNTFRRQTVTAPVKWWATHDGPLNWSHGATDIARRQKASGYLHPGAVAWVQTSQKTGEVSAIKLAAAWRSLVPVGQGTRPRVPGNRLACQDPEDLCLSCATFGMVDATGSREGKGQHAAYAGHVRFGAATGNAVTRMVQLTPMGAPSSGAAGMYLRDEDLPTDRPRGDKPSQWGSAVDTTGQGRGIRGRKFYWHADPDAQAAGWSAALPQKVGTRYEAREHHERRTGMGAEARSLVPAGTTLTQTITFDGLDRAALVALAAAIDPSSILGVLYKRPVDAAHHLGGGKPLGLGTTTARITAATIWPGAARYTGGEAEPAETLTPTATDLALINKRCGPKVRLSIGRTGRALTRDALGDDANLVWYPPQGVWGDRTTEKGREDFDQSYAFFAQNSGERLERSDRDYEVLPPLNASSQRMLNARNRRAQRVAGPPGAGRKTGQGGWSR